MPYYDYEIRDEQTGAVVATVCLSRPVEGRDNLTLHRKSVPDSIAFSGTAAHPVLGREGFPGLIKQGYHQLEQKHGSRFNLSEFGGANRVKEIWR